MTERIIACAIEVQKAIGPGLLEATYEETLCVELGLAGLRFSRQTVFPVLHKGKSVGEYRLDLLVEERVVVEIKSVERMESRVLKLRSSRTCEAPAKRWDC